MSLPEPPLSRAAARRREAPPARAIAIGPWVTLAERRARLATLYRYQARSAAAAIAARLAAAPRA